MSRLPLEKFSTPDLSDEFSVPRCNLTTYSDNMGPSFDGHSFERVVIDVHGLRFGRNGGAVFWIINDQVRITTQLDRSFFWK